MGVPEKGGYDDVVFGGIEGFVAASEPEVIGYHFWTVSTVLFRRVNYSRPEYHVGYMMAGKEGSPSVLYAMKASGISPPDLRAKLPSLYV